jgi:hypothetical protein
MKVFTELLPRNDMGRHRQTHRHTRPTILLLALLHVLVATGTCLASRRPAIKGGLHFAEPLPVNNRRDTHTDTRTDGRDL